MKHFGKRREYEGDPFECPAPCGYRFRSKVLFTVCPQCGSARVRRLDRHAVVELTPPKRGRARKPAQRRAAAV